MTSEEISSKLFFLSAKQAQAVDNICLLLDGLERESDRLPVYLGAFHFIVDGLEATGKALEELAEQMGGMDETPSIRADLIAAFERARSDLAAGKIDVLDLGETIEKYVLGVDT